MSIKGKFLTHWFIGIFIIILGVWALLGAAYLLGAGGVTIRARGGQSATLDFMRDQSNSPVVGLADGIGLNLYVPADATQREAFTATTVALRPVPIVMCLCGDYWLGAPIGRVEYRHDDWFYRAPKDESKNPNLKTGAGAKSWQDSILTLAYNRATKERVLVDRESTFAEQQQLLEQRGLDTRPDNQLTSRSIIDLKTVSMRSERCMIYLGAFIATLLLWLLIGGPIALIQRRLR